MRSFQVHVPNDEGGESTAILGRLGDGAEQPWRCATMSLPLAGCAVLVLGAVALVCSARAVPASRSGGRADLQAFEYPALGAPANPELSAEADRTDGGIEGDGGIEDEGKKQRVLAECIIDVDHAAMFLMEAGNFISYVSSDNCSTNKETENQRLCAIEATTVITSFVMIAMYISEAVSNCGMRLNVGAVCTRNLAMLTDLLGEFATIATVMRTACKLNASEPDEVEEVERRLWGPSNASMRVAGVQRLQVPDVRRLWGLSNASMRAAGVQRLQMPDVRRLRSLSNASRGAAGVQRQPASAALRQTPLERVKTFYGRYEKKLKADAAKIRSLARPMDDKQEHGPELRPTSISQCSVSVNLGATYIPLAILEMFEAKESCEESPEHREVCAFDVLSVLQYLGWAVQFLAGAAIECPGIGNKNAECTVFVSDLVASIAGLGPAVAGISEYCQPEMISPVR